MSFLLSGVSSYSPVHRAAGNGDIRQLARLHRTGSDLNARCDGDTFFGQHSRFARSLTPLMVAAAASTSSVACVSWLLERGADARQTSAAEVDALWYAAVGGDAVRVATLLLYSRRDAVVGWRLAAAAALSGSHDSLALLLAAGASPHAGGRSGVAPGASGVEIPLFAAAASGSAACVRLLIEAGVAPDVRDAKGRTALMCAGSAEAVRALVAAGCPINTQTSGGMTALKAVIERQRAIEWAVDQEHPRVWDARELGRLAAERQAGILDALLDAGADLSARDDRGETVLMYTCRANGVSPSIVARLLVRGADVHARCSAGRTALHAAALSASDRAIVSELLVCLTRAGLPLDVCDDNGQTPLHAAISKEPDGLGALAALLDAGANLNARDHSGSTPLILCAERLDRRYAEMRRLIDAGADRTLATYSGQTAYLLAVKRVAALRVALQQQDEARTSPYPGSTYRCSAIDRASTAARRLALRAAAAALALLGEPTAPTELRTLPAYLPRIWVGYRAVTRRALPEDWADVPRLEHVAQVASFGHAFAWDSAMNAACCFDSDAAAEQMLSQPRWPPEEAHEIHAYGVYAWLFEHTGLHRPVAATELLGEHACRPQPPDAARYECLGFDIKECRPGEQWGQGCAPLSPYCDGLARSDRVLVNQWCLIDDLSHACDLAAVLALSNPAAGPYAVVSVWRSRTRGAPPGAESRSRS